jgi:hypothetical protein
MRIYHVQCCNCNLWGTPLTPSPKRTTPMKCGNCNSLRTRTYVEIKKLSFDRDAKTAKKYNTVDKRFT